MIRERDTHRDTDRDRDRDRDRDETLNVHELHIHSCQNFVFSL